jgi:hypothetical protein
MQVIHRKFHRKIYLFIAFSLFIWRVLVINQLPYSWVKNSVGTLKGLGILACICAVLPIFILQLGPAILLILVGFLFLSLGFTIEITLHLVAANEKQQQQITELLETNRQHQRDIYSLRRENEAMNKKYEVLRKTLSQSKPPTA